MDELIFQTPVESNAEAAEQPSKPNLKPSNRRERLGFAFFALVLFMVVYFARPEDWIPGLAAVPLAKITGVLILLALVLSMGNIRWHLPQEIIFLTLLVVQLWLTVPFSPVYKRGALDVMLDFSKVLPLVVVIYAAIRSMKRFRWILVVQAASVAAIASASIVRAHTVGGRLQGALSGMYGNPNDLAFAIDLSLPLCLAVALTTRSYWKKLAWTVAMLAMIYSVFLTASRGGAIALVVVALVCLWELGVKSRRFYLLLLVPVAVIVVWLHGQNAFRERFEVPNTNPTATGNPSFLAAGSTPQRKQLLFRSLEVTAEHPLLGIGPGNFPIISGVWHETHNSYTQISSEGGIPGFLLYALFLWRGIVNLRDIRRDRKTGSRNLLFSMALEASLAGYLVGSFFASDAYQFFPYCLVTYTSALRFIIQRGRIVSGRAPKSGLAPPQIEVPVWQ